VQVRGVEPRKGGNGQPERRGLIEDGKASKLRSAAVDGVKKLEGGLRVRGDWRWTKNVCPSDGNWIRGKTVDPVKWEVTSKVRTDSVGMKFTPVVEAGERGTNKGRNVAEGGGGEKT